MDTPSQESLVHVIHERLLEVQEEIAVAAARSGRAASDIRLVAVTKTHPAAVLQAAQHAGITEIGENYLQEAEEKFSELAWPEAGNGPAPVQRHAIGHIQSNKVRTALRWFDIIETVDSLSLAQRIDRLAGEMGRTIPVLVQVNISHDPEKFGILPDDVAGILQSMENLAHIQVKGLMTIGRLTSDLEIARRDFAALRTLRNDLREHIPSTISLDELSMGMSHDFAVAIEEGATIVRIGSRLFGSRS